MRGFTAHVSNCKRLSGKLFLPDYPRKRSIKHKKLTKSPLANIYINKHKISHHLPSRSSSAAFHQLLSTLPPFWKHIPWGSSPLKLVPRAQKHLHRIAQVTPMNVTLCFSLLVVARFICNWWYCLCAIHRRLSWYHFKHKPISFNWRILNWLGRLL